MNHSKGKLGVRKWPDGAVYISIVGTSTVIAGPNNCLEEAEANARRICQCVNNFDDLLKFAGHKGYCFIAQCLPIECTGRNPDAIKCNCGWNELKQSIAKAESEG